MRGPVRSFTAVLSEDTWCVGLLGLVMQKAVKEMLMVYWDPRRKGMLMI